MNGDCQSGAFRNSQRTNTEQFAESAFEFEYESRRDIQGEVLRQDYSKDIKFAGDYAKKAGVPASRYSTQKVAKDRATQFGNSRTLAIAREFKSDRINVFLISARPVSEPALVMYAIKGTHKARQVEVNP